jgi:hypothetical protein
VPAAPEPRAPPPAAPASEPVFQPGERQRSTDPPAAPVEPPRTETRPAPTAPAPARTVAPPPAEPAATPQPERRPADSVAAPAPETEPETSAADTRELRDALVARVPVQREMTTGMSLSFEVMPKDRADEIVIRFDRIVIGRAADWNAKRRGGRAYAIAEPGLHILTFLVDGTEMHRIRIDAQPQGASPTTIPLNLPQARRGRRPGGR